MLRISASQIKSDTACSRQWWLRSGPLRLPTKPKGNLDRGTCLHSVCERYLNADDLGRDPSTGEEVNLYPEGWDVVPYDEDHPELGGRKLPASDAKLIQRLVTTAIDAGILERRPGRVVEEEINRDVIEGVSLKGYVDCLLPAEVWDHKTTKSLRYAQSPKSLASDQQMLVYAKEAIERDPDLPRVTLRHNVFVCDPSDPVVKKVETTVSRRDVEQAWVRTQAQAARMKALAETAKTWQEIDGPNEPNACSAYGGCAFRSICGGTETVEQYRERVTREIENEKTHPEVDSLEAAWDRLEQQQQTRRENNTVALDIFARRAAAKPAAAPAPAAPAAPAINGAPPPVAQPAPQSAVAEASVPPWARPDCAACKGTGISKAGRACMICDSRNKAQGAITSDAFVVEPDGAGNLVWEAKDGSGGGSAPIPTDKPVQAPRVAKPAVAVEPHPMESVPEAELEALAEMPASITPQAAPSEAVEETEAEESPADDPTPQPPAVRSSTKATSKGGRPKAGFYLYIGCMPTGVSTTPIEPLFADLAQDMADAAREKAEAKGQPGPETYGDMDPFRRRDVWMNVARSGKLAEVLNKHNLVVSSLDGNPDLRAFVDAIRSIAQPGRVVVGVR